MKTKLLVFASLLCALTACQDDSSDTKETAYKPIKLTAAEQQLASQSTDFVFNYFHSIEATAQGSAGGQTVVSPLSASLALGMLTNGAAGETQQQLLQALGFSHFSLEDMNSYNEKLTHDLLNQDASTKLVLANSVWVDKQFDVLGSFKSTMLSAYDADIREVEMGTAVPAINQWCADKTSGLVADFLGSLSAEAKAVLLNASYFKGKWAKAFSAKDTETGEFANADGTVSQISLMRQSDNFSYGGNATCEVARFGYGNGAFALYVVLPNEGTSVEQCLENMDGDTWETLTESMELRRMNVRFPKFSIKSAMQQQEAFEALGATRAFSPAADFSGMAEGGLYVGQVRQAITISFDEEGTEAAAVTGTYMVSDYQPDGETVDFYIQRPFFFLLTEQSTGAVLFMGKVTKM